MPNNRFEELVQQGAGRILAVRRQNGVRKSAAAERKERVQLRLF